MTKPNFQSVEDYIASQPGPAAKKLSVVRSTIRTALPHAQETIAYNMPAYKLNGRVILCFAGWKQHYSLYAASAGLLDAFQQELASYKVDKGTIRFSLADPVPRKLIADVARFRAAETVR